MRMPSRMRTASCGNAWSGWNERSRQVPMAGTADNELLAAIAALMAQDAAEVLEEARAVAREHVREVLVLAMRESMLEQICGRHASPDAEAAPPMTASEPVPEPVRTE